MNEENLMASSADLEKAAAVAADVVVGADASFAPPAPTATARVVAYARDRLVAFAPHVTQELIKIPNG